MSDLAYVTGRVCASERDLAQMIEQDASRGSSDEIGFGYNIDPLEFVNPGLSEAECEDLVYENADILRGISPCYVSKQRGTMQYTIKTPCIEEVTCDELFRSSESMKKLLLKLKEGKRSFCIQYGAYKNNCLYGDTFKECKEWALNHIWKYKKYPVYIFDYKKLIVYKVFFKKDTVSKTNKKTVEGKQIVEELFYWNYALAYRW